LSPLPVRAEAVRDAAPLARDLEEVLGENCIEVQVGSPLEGFLLDVYRCDYERHAEFVPEASYDVPRRYATMFGVVELAEHLVALRHHRDFTALRPLLALLGATTSTLNVPSRPTDQAANRLFELFVACWVLHRGADTVVETPKGGPNPDILTTLDGRRWGFACKTIHSLHPEALVGNLKKGVDQILRSPAEIGVVTVNLKNVLNHSKYWYRMPEADSPDGAHAWSVFPNAQVPYDLLVGEIRAIWDDLALHIGLDELKTIFGSPRLVPGIQVWAHTAAGCVLGGTPRASAVRCFAFAAVGELSEWQRKALDRLKADATRFGTRPLVGEGP
jgi:hypothetical protein